MRSFENIRGRDTAPVISEDGAIGVLLYGILCSGFLVFGYWNRICLGDAAVRGARSMKSRWETRSKLMLDADQRGLCFGACEWS